MPQSVQSLPSGHAENSAPGPPSSQSPSLAKLPVSPHSPDEPAGGGEEVDDVVGGGGEGDGGGGEAAGVRGPQSTQSVPYEHEVYSVPGPPSSQSPSLA